MLLFCCPPQTLHESPDWRHLKSDGSHPCSQKADCTDTAFGLNIPAPSKVRTFLAVFTFCPLCLFLVVLPSLDHFNAILIVSATSSCKPETYYFVVTWIFHVMGRISPTLRKIIKAMWDCFLWRWWCFFSDDDDDDDDDDEGDSITIFFSQGFSKRRCFTHRKQQLFQSKCGVKIPAVLKGNV